MEDYQKPFSEMLSRTSTEWAPWYVIRAERKWFASGRFTHELMEITPRFPGVTKELRESLREAEEMLEAQVPRGAHAGPFEHEQRTARAAASGGWNGHESNTESAALADPPASE